MTDSAAKAQDIMSATVKTLESHKYEFSVAVDTSNKTMRKGKHYINATGFMFNLNLN